MTPKEIERRFDFFSIAESFRLVSDSSPAALERLIPEPVELLIEHPFADRRWILAKKLIDPHWFLLCTADGLTLALHECQFRVISR